MGPHMEAPGEGDLPERLGPGQAGYAIPVLHVMFEFATPLSP